MVSDSLWEIDYTIESSPAVFDQKWLSKAPWLPCVWLSVSVHVYSCLFLTKTLQFLKGGDLDSGNGLPANWIISSWTLMTISDYKRTSQIEIDHKNNSKSKSDQIKNVKWSLLHWWWLNLFSLDSSKELDFHLNSLKLSDWIQPRYNLNSNPENDQGR